MNLNRWLPHWATLGVLSLLSYWWRPLALVVGVWLLVDTWAIWSLQRRGSL